MPVPTLISEISQTPASNSPVGNVDTPSSIDNYQRTHASFIAQLRDGKGFTNTSTLASAAALDIGGQNAMFVEVTGTTTVTSFGTNYNGPRFLRFAGVLTLTHNATTLILPGAANITTAAGDTCVVVPKAAAGVANGWTVVSYQRASGAAIGASSDLISHLPSGTGAVATTVQSQLRSIQAQEVHVKDAPFYAVGDGVTDDTAALIAAITYAKTLSRPKLVIDSGVFFTTSLVRFDLPSFSTIEFIGDITSNVVAAPAIEIGSPTANTFGLYVTGVKVSRTAFDTTGGSTGVRLRNLVWSHVDIRRCTNFQDGVWCLGDQGNGGFSYNEVHFGYIHDNKRNVLLSAANGLNGYCNENNFFGGSFNHSSGYPAVATVNLEIADYPTNELNNNRFYGPSFEDNTAIAVAASISGNNNVIFWPRMENPSNQATYPIEFTANSGECQLLGGSFTISPTNISDLGDGNSYETRQGRAIRAQTPAGDGSGVFRGRSTVSSAARIFVAEDTSGTAEAYIQGDGFVYSASTGYFENGVRFSTGNGLYDDCGLFVGTGTPEGVVTAITGSLYVNKAGGAGTTLYVKQSGSGNTGWVGK